MKVSLLALLLSPTLALAASPEALPHADRVSETAAQGLTLPAATDRSRRPPRRSTRPPPRTTSGPARPSRPLARPGSAPPPRTRPPASRPPASRVAPVAVRPGYPVQPAPVTIVRARPYHGVLVYGPRPTHHVTYAAPPRPGPPQAVARDHLPTRNVDRAKSLSVGVTIGSMVNRYQTGRVFGDFGLGLQTRYRPSEAFAIELAAAHYSQSFGADTRRARTSGSLSGMVFIMPWAKISPYLLGGLTVTGVHRDLSLDFDVAPAAGGAKPILFGPHGGVGVEIALGPRFSFDIDARLAGYVNRGDDRVSSPAAFTGNLGLTTYF